MFMVKLTMFILTFKTKVGNLKFNKKSGLYETSRWREARFLGKV